jgi:hypothetical protein
MGYWLNLWIRYLSKCYGWSLFFVLLLRLLVGELVLFVLVLVLLVL